jgi:hypothetical protein
MKRKINNILVELGTLLMWLAVLSQEYITHWEKGEKNSRFWRDQTIDKITEIEKKLNEIKLLIANSK